jgi:integrase
MRRSEILALHWSDIDFDNRIINISKSVAPSKDGYIFKEPKTKSSIRTVPIAEHIIPLLKQYQEEYNELRNKFGDGWKGKGNLFIQADGKLMSLHSPRDRFLKQIKRYNKWAVKNGSELLPEIPLHGLRHSCATFLNILDTNIVDIANMLGHAQTSTTWNIYSHSFEGRKTVVVNKIDEYMKAYA